MMTDRVENIDTSRRERTRVATSRDGARPLKFNNPRALIGTRRRRCVWVHVVQFFSTVRLPVVVHLVLVLGSRIVISVISGSIDRSRVYHTPCSPLLLPLAARCARLSRSTVEDEAAAAPPAPRRISPLEFFLHFPALFRFDFFRRSLDYREASV